MMSKKRKRVTEASFKSLNIIGSQFMTRGDTGISSDGPVVSKGSDNDQVTE